MNDAYDEALQALFAAAREDLEGSDLTRRVVAATQRQRLLRLGTAALVVVALLTGAWAWLALPLLDFALLLSRTLTASLLDLGESWLALLLLPLNSLGGLLALGTKAVLMLRRRMLAATLTRR